MFKFFIGYDRTAIGESFMDGQWECSDLVEFVEKAFRTKNITGSKNVVMSTLLHSLPLVMFNLQTKLLSKQHISAHYDIGNDLFKLMLDRAMNYSCGYWEKCVLLGPYDSNNNSGLKVNTVCETLDEAQRNKMFLIAKKLHLKPNMTVLDIGCGWGYLAKFLAINFGMLFFYLFLID